MSVFRAQSYGTVWLWAGAEDNGFTAAVSGVLPEYGTPTRDYAGPLAYVCAGVCVCQSLGAGAGARFRGVHSFCEQARAGCRLGVLGCVQLRALSGRVCPKRVPRGVPCGECVSALCLPGRRASWGC